MASQSIIWNLIRPSPFRLAHRLVPELLMGGRPPGEQRPCSRAVAANTCELPGAELTLIFTSDQGPRFWFGK